MALTIIKPTLPTRANAEANRASMYYHKTY